MSGKTIIINRTMGEKDIYPVQIKCQCGRVLLLLKKISGNINQQQKCNKCKNIVSINIQNKDAS